MTQPLGPVLVDGGAKRRPGSHWAASWVIAFAVAFAAINIVFMAMHSTFHSRRISSAPDAVIRSVRVGDRSHSPVVAHHRIFATMPRGNIPGSNTTAIADIFKRNEVDGRLSLFIRPSSSEPSTSPLIPLQGIDAVITHVDSAAPGWFDTALRVAKRRQTRLEMARFRDNGEVQFTLLSIMQHASRIVRRVWLVVADEAHAVRAFTPQVRSAARKMGVELRTVDHATLFHGVPAASLPTFNSNAIETVLHRIQGLSPLFLYFNDDMVLGRELRWADLLRPKKHTASTRDDDGHHLLELEVVPMFERAERPEDRCRTRRRHRAGVPPSAPQISMEGVRVVVCPGADGGGSVHTDTSRSGRFTAAPGTRANCSRGSNGDMFDGEQGPFAIRARVRDIGSGTGHPQVIVAVEEERALPEVMLDNVQVFNFSYTIMPPDVCTFDGNGTAYSLALAFYRAVWKQRRIMQMNPDVVMSDDPATASSRLDRMLAAARREATRYGTTSPESDEGAPGTQKTERPQLNDVAASPSSHRLRRENGGFNTFVRVNRERAGTQFGVLPSHTFAHVPRLIDRDRLRDMVDRVLPSGDVDRTRLAPFRDPRDVWIPMLYSWLLAADNNKAASYTGGEEKMQETTSLRSSHRHIGRALDRDPDYFFAMFATPQELERFTTEMTRQRSLFVAVNDNVRTPELNARTRRALHDFLVVASRLERPPPFAP